MVDQGSPPPIQAVGSTDPDVREKFVEVLRSQSNPSGVGLLANLLRGDAAGDILIAIGTGLNTYAELKKRKGEAGR